MGKHKGFILIYEQEGQVQPTHDFLVNLVTEHDLLNYFVSC